MVQKNAITIAAMVAPLEDSRLAGHLLVLAGVAGDLASGAPVDDRLDHFDGHRISLCFRIWITLNTMSGMTRMNSRTASAAACP